MAFDLSMPILVVDDYNTMIRIIRNLLKQIGFENVDDASDGSAALAKMQGKKYGLVISDWNMEPMTGYDLLREVRASPELSQDPVHHDHRGIEDRERHCREEGRRQQLHRQAVQRGDAEDQDGSGVWAGRVDGLSLLPRIDRPLQTPEVDDTDRRFTRATAFHGDRGSVPGSGAAQAARGPETKTAGAMNFSPSDQEIRPHSARPDARGAIRDRSPRVTL